MGTVHGTNYAPIGPARCAQAGACIRSRDPRGIGTATVKVKDGPRNGLALGGVAFRRTSGRLQNMPVQPLSGTLPEFRIRPGMKGFSGIQAARTIDAAGARLRSRLSATFA
jgi:hypothetical protein